MNIGNVWTAFLNSSKKTTSFIFVHGMYLFGIGITSLTAKILKKNFLEMKTSDTTWQKPKYSDDFKSMY